MIPSATPTSIPSTISTVTSSSAPTTISTLTPSAAPSAIPTTAPAATPAVTNSSGTQPLYTVAPVDGPTYLANVMAATASFNHNEILAAYAAASLVPIKQGADYAVVCLQDTTVGLFRLHSQNPAAIGLVANSTDIEAFKHLNHLKKGATFNYNIPVNVNGTGSSISYSGQVFLKHGDGTASGDAICFARYH